MHKLMLLFSLAVFTLAACGTPKTTDKDTSGNDELVEDTADPDPSDMEPVYNYNTRLHDIWVVRTINHEPWPEGVPAPRLEIYPKEGRINGFGGCNEFFGGCNVNGDNITFARIGTTKKFCKDAMEMETQFIATLQDVDRYQIKGLQLLLGTAGKSVMSLQKVD